MSIGSGNNSPLCCLHVHFSFCLVIISKEQEISKLHTSYPESFSLVLVGLLCRPPSAKALFQSFSVIHAKYYSSSFVYSFGKVSNGSKSKCSLATGLKEKRKYEMTANTIHGADTAREMRLWIPQTSRRCLH